MMNWKHFKKSFHTSSTCLSMLWKNNNGLNPPLLIKKYQSRDLSYVLLASSETTLFFIFKCKHPEISILGLLWMFKQFTHSKARSINTKISVETNQCETIHERVRQWGNCQTRSERSGTNLREKRSQSIDKNSVCLFVQSRRMLCPPCSGSNCWRNVTDKESDSPNSIQITEACLGRFL